MNHRCVITLTTWKNKDFLSVERMPKYLFFQSLKSEDMLTPLRRMVLEESGGDVSRNDTQSSVYVEQTPWTKVGLQWETKKPSEITSRYCRKRLMPTDSLTNRSRYTTVTRLRSTVIGRPKGCFSCSTETRTLRSSCH